MPRYRTAGGREWFMFVVFNLSPNMHPIGVSSTFGQRSSVDDGHVGRSNSRKARQMTIVTCKVCSGRLRIPDDKRGTVTCPCGTSWFHSASIKDSDAEFSGIKMTDGTSRTLVIENSPKELLSLVIAGLLLIAGAIVVTFLPNVSFYRKVFFGYFGAGVFGLATGLALWRLVTSRGPVITISPEGIRDTRLAVAVIPWSVVTGISTREVHGQRLMVLGISPRMEGCPV
jgi:hypothetical protein